MFKLVIFDMDGVITNTAVVHARAWKSVFDEMLAKRSQRKGETFKEFRIDSDYHEHVDGKPRLVGIGNFLRSRDIELPHGEDTDQSVESVVGIGNKKDRIFLDLIDELGVEVFKDCENLINHLSSVSIDLAVASSSKNCRYLLERASLTKYFKKIYDGNTIKERHLRGKPHPDMFSELIKEFSCSPSDVIIIEDAISGVQASKAANVGLTLGLDRIGQNLKEAGADKVVSSLSDVTAQKLASWHEASVHGQLVKSQTSEKL